MHLRAYGVQSYHVLVSVELIFARLETWHYGARSHFLLLIPVILTNPDKL